MATKKEIELKGETMEKSPVFAGAEKELFKKIVLLEAENALLPQLKEEVASLKKELLSVKRSNEEIAANEHGIRKLLERSEHVAVELKEKAEQTITQLKEKEKELLSLKKSNEEITANEHTIKILNEKLNTELKEEKNKKELEVNALSKEKILAINSLQTQIENLKNDLNKLASLFDEYINAYQDQTKMLSVFVKNTQTVEKYLSQKIEQFNGGSKK